MINERKSLSYHKLSRSEQIIVQEYAKAILRAKVINIISGLPHQFSNDAADNHFTSLVDEILSQGEQGSLERLLNESLKPLEQNFRGNVVACAACLLNNSWNRDKCENECDIPLKPPDED